MMSPKLLRALALVVACALAGVAVTASANPLRIAIEGSYPPFSEKDGKQGWKGFDVDIARALCERMRAECELVQRDWDRIQDALLGREVDAIVASMSMSRARKQRFAFSKKYYQVPARFVGRAGPSIEVDGGGLDGRRIGVQGNTVHEKFVKATFHGKAEIFTFATLPEATQALALGRIDLVMGDSLALAKGFLATPEGHGFDFVGPPFVNPRWFGDGIGIALRKEDQDLKARFDAAIDAIRADGTYDAISRRYFDFDIYGG
jgi:arginine/ornithine transport system substrate-binding protein